MKFLDWYQFKLFMEHAIGISMDALHILIGFAIVLVAARLLRRTIASLLPWLILLILELGNEAYDLRVEVWPNLGMQLGEGAKDVMLTMAIPTLLLLIARWWPSLLGNASADDDVTGRAQVLVAEHNSSRQDDQRQ
jgi:hypothetical protein